MLCLRLYKHDFFRIYTSDGVIDIKCVRNEGRGVGSKSTVIGVDAPKSVKILRDKCIEENDAPARDYELPTEEIEC